MRNGKIILQGLLCFILVFSLIFPLSGCGSPPPAAPEPDTLSMVQVLSSSGLADTAWPKFRHNAQNTGRSPYTGSQTPELKWSFATGGPVSSSPATGADGSIYIASTDENLYAVGPDGTQRWSFHVGPADGYRLASPAIGADGTVYIGSGDGNLYAINPDGTEKWRFASGSHISDSSPAIGADGTVYIGSANGYLYAINPDGTEKWSAKTLSHIRSSPAIGADGTIYVGGLPTYDYAGKMFAINPDGTEKWTLPTDGRSYSSPAIGPDGTIYVGTDVPGHLYAIDQDGTEKWRFAAEGSVLSSPGIASDGTVYVGSIPSDGGGGGRVYAVNPDGTERWRFATGSWVQSSLAIGADGTVYVGSLDNNLYALNSDGSEKWSFATGSWVQSSPAIGADGTIYVGSHDGNLYAIGEGAPETGLADSAWPKFGQNLQNTARSPYVGPQTPDLKWTADVGHQISGCPVIGADGTIYVGADDRYGYSLRGELHAIDSDGSLKWSFTADGRFFVTSPALAADGTVYIGSTDYKLYALGPDGNEKWSFDTGYYIRDSSPTIGSDGTVYIGGQTKLYAIDPDGIEKWNFPTGQLLYSSPSIGDDGTIYVGSSAQYGYAGKLHSVAPDGTVKWSLTTDGRPISPSIGADGTIYVYVSYPSYDLCAIDPDGTEKWRFHTGDDFVCGDLGIGADGTIYMGSWYGTLYAVDPDGNARWEFNTAEDRHLSGVAVDGEGTIYVGTNDGYDGYLYAVNPDGTKKWKFGVGSPGFVSPAIGSDGIIYAGFGGQLHAIGEAAPPSDAPIARASDISGQEKVMYPDEPYTVTAKYFDPDGREDLKYCYLRLNHPAKNLTMMWDEATDDFWTYAGEEGENYLRVSGNSSPITEEGLEGYELAWTFNISDQWPEAENAIDFGVYAWDDSDLKSGWDYDDTKASFLLSAPEVGHVILIEPLRASPGDPHFVGDTLAASFAVQNVGDAAITLDKLLVRGMYYGGELPGGGFPDFSYHTVTLLPGDTHEYKGDLDITEVGKYDFYIAYYIENPTETEKQYLDEHKWNTCIDLAPELTDDDRTWQVIALAPPIRNIAYIPVKFAGEEAPVDIRGLRGTAQFVRQYYYQQSYGKEVLSHVFVFDEWQELPKTREQYPSIRLWTKFSQPQHDIISDAIAIARSETGFDPDQYDVVVVITTDGSITAQAIEGRAIVSADQPTGIVGQWAHELGHALPHLLWKDYQDPPEGGSIGQWDLMGDGTRNNPPPAIMGYRRVKEGWLEYRTIDWGTFDVKLLQDLGVGDRVLRWHANVSTEYPYYIIEGRHPPDNVILDDRKGPASVLTYEEGILLYGVSRQSKVYSIPHNNSDHYKVTLTGGDSYIDDRGSVTFTAIKEGSQWKIDIQPMIPKSRKVISMSDANVNWQTGAQQSGEPSGSSFDVDLHVYTRDGRKVGMDYDTGKYVLQINDARASGNILGGGPEWISVPDHEDVYFVVDPTQARKWAEENGIEDLEIGVEVQVVFYDDEGQSTQTEPLVLPVSLDRSVYCVATATGTGIAGFTTSHGTVEDLEALAVPAAPPSGYTFPHGIFSFKVTELDYDGQTATVNIDLPTAVPAGTKWWKYHDGQWHDYSIPITISGNTITITVTDGGIGDIDGIADGIITDPGGPGYPMAPFQLPDYVVGWEGSPINKAAVTAPFIGLLAVMAGVGILMIRRRRIPN